MTLDEQIADLQGNGFELVQEGRVLIPDSPAARKARICFSERVEGFDITRLGVHDATNGWRSPYENYILDDEQRWVHMRKERVE